jgi:uncharacterized protein YkwD
MMHRQYPWLSLLSIVLLTPALVHGQAGEQKEDEVVQLSAPPGPREDRHPDLVRASDEIIQRTNEFRQKQDHAKVRVSAKLTATASYFADYMARTNRYGHHADGNNPGERVRKHDYDYCIVGENIAYEYNSAGLDTAQVAQTFFEGWKHSPPHRKNMLDPDVVETGVAVAHSKKTGYFYAVQLFGRPHADALVFTTSNDSNITIKYRIGDRTFSLPPRYTRTHTQCRPTQVTFDLPDEITKVIRPRNGDHFTVARRDDKIVIVDR